MKHNNYYFLCILTVLLIPHALFSQTASVNNVRAFKIKNVDAIVENDEVKGYLGFYLVEKKDSKNNTFKLDIWDNNLNKKYDIDLTRPKSTYFLESSYNGDGFCYYFYNKSEKQLDYITFNKVGKKTGMYSVKDLSKYEINMLVQKTASENNEFFGGLVGIPTKGFARYGLDKEKGRSGIIEMIDTTAKKVWSKTINGDDDNDYIIVFPLTSSKDVLISTVYMRESMFTQSIKKSYFKFQNTTNGEDLFVFNSKGDKHLYSMYGASFEGDEIFTYGEYFAPDANITKDKSLGLYVLIFDKTGKVVKENYIKWDEEIGKVVPGTLTDEKGKRISFAMHKMVKTADNNYFVICEQYYRTADAAGIVMNVLNNDHSNAVTKIVLKNMIVLQLDSDLDLVKGDIVEKEKGNVHLAAGLDFYGNSFIAMYLKMTGQFDYCFTNLSPDKKTFSSSYVNYDKESEGNHYVIGTISYTKDQKIAVDRISLKDKPTSFTVLPAKPGYVGVLEYYKKTKTLDIRLEKLNL